MNGRESVTGGSQQATHTSVVDSYISDPTWRKASAATNSATGVSHRGHAITSSAHRAVSVGKTTAEEMPTIPRVRLLAAACLASSRSSNSGPSYLRNSASDATTGNSASDTTAGRQTVALNYDRDDNTADGLSHGLYRRLQDLLPEREFVSAGDIVRGVRGLKSETELERVRRAAETTEELLQTATSTWDPDTTEAAFASFVHDRLQERDLGTAWAWDYCPTVHMGGDSEVGHTMPGEHTLSEGELLHVDFGVRRDDYAADIQRLWVRGEPSAALRSVFRDVRAAIDAGHERLEPGVVGHEVDTAARAELTDRGHPPFQHAFGHQVGRVAHDGGTLLAPEWERYGEAPRGEVRAGEIYTMELGVDTEWGYVGQEEMVRVTETGTEWVVAPQTRLRRL